MDDKAQRCGHGTCKCSVKEGERYCSKHCEEHAKMNDPAGKVMCGCGHPECGSSEAAA